MKLDRTAVEFLFIREEPVEADLAIVFGSADFQELASRTRRGVELHQAGHVPRLVLTGGGRLAPAAPEARRMAEIARELDVPRCDLIIEDRSNNTFENARCCRGLLQELNLLENLKTVLLVSSEWHMRRVLWTMQTEFPSEIQFICCPSLEGCTRQNWNPSDEHLDIVRPEIRVLMRFHASGLFRRVDESTMARLQQS